MAAYYASERSFLKTKFGYDDTLDAFGCHGIGGTWGGIATGLFATTAVNGDGANGLFYGNASLLLKQLVAIGATYAFTIIMTYAIIKAINFFLPVRVDEHEEHMGLDISMHGEKARCNLLVIDCISFAHRQHTPPSITGNILTVLDISTIFQIYRLFLSIYQRFDTRYRFTNKFRHNETEEYPRVTLHKKTTETQSSFPIYFGAFPTYCVISTFNACAKRIPYS